MLFTVSALSLLGVAAASPIAACNNPNANKPSYPAKQTSKGFKLVANVTDPSRDFKDPIHNKFLTPLHTGAAVNVIGIARDGDKAPVFYQTGNQQERLSGATRIAVDLGTPPSAFGFSLQSDNGKSFASTAHADAGAGQAGVSVTHDPVPFAFLNLAEFAICEEPLPALQNQQYKVLHQFNTLSSAEKIPEDCVPITVIPQCATLEDLLEGSRASHDDAFEAGCYEDVSSIEWSKYSSFNWNSFSA
ncbi:hypothetical protein K4F52_006999 [Lecanicillium sp. MT-2017a]|nr:hypothetical protein K4F52_006999 [Lecanicillium sp. MT-2017a]